MTFVTIKIFRLEKKKKLTPWGMTGLACGWLMEVGIGRLLLQHGMAA